jgi:hypothetical protein
LASPEKNSSISCWSGKNNKFLVLNFGNLEYLATCNFWKLEKICEANIFPNNRTFNFTQSEKNISFDFWSLEFRIFAELKLVWKLEKKSAYAVPKKIISSSCRSGKK